MKYFSCSDILFLRLWALFFSRNLTDGQWYSFNDQHVSKVSIETAVLLSLLFPQLQWFLAQENSMTSFLLQEIMLQNYKGGNSSNCLNFHKKFKKNL